MAYPEDPAFKQFVTQRRRDLQRIARSTQGEHHLSDVINEAWLVAFGLTARKGVSVDFLSKSFQDLLISHLYQQLVRYTEQNVRRAIRLDHATPHGDHDYESHHLMGTLVSDDGRHPLAVLIEQEATSVQDIKIDYDSLASAYVRLMRHFGNKMQAVADYLLISVSYAYKRCAHARLLAIHQNPVRLPIIDESFLPGPWRRFRIRRTPFQWSFNFDEELPLQYESHDAPVGASSGSIPTHMQKSTETVGFCI